MIARRPLLAAMLALPAIARAQPAWPSRPVRIVVPFPPGGSNDVIARPLADRLQARLGQPFVVENRAGAAGAIGAGQVAQAAPDGTTLMVTSSSFATSAVLQRTPWDAEASFDAVALLARAPFFILANPGFAPRTVAELVEHGRANPGGIDYGTSGGGSIGHFITEAFCLAAGLRMNHVSYRGTAPAVTDLIAGHIQLLITTVASANAAIREGRVRVIAATAPDGDLPPGVAPAATVRDQGIDYEVAIWWGLLAPRGLPPELRAAIHGAVNGALGDPAIRRVYDAEGARPSPVGPGEFAAMLNADLARWRQVAQAAKITLE